MPEKLEILPRIDGHANTRLKKILQTVMERCTNSCKHWEDRIHEEGFGRGKRSERAQARAGAKGCEGMPNGKVTKRHRARRRTKKHVAMGEGEGQREAVVPKEAAGGVAHQKLARIAVQPDPRGSKHHQWPLTSEASSTLREEVDY